jgi:hypothetical protein
MGVTSASSMGTCSASDGTTLGGPELRLRCQCNCHRAGSGRRNTGWPRRKVEQLKDLLLVPVLEIVRPNRPNGHGLAWWLLLANHDLLKKWSVDLWSVGGECRGLAGRSRGDRPGAHGAA